MKHFSESNATNVGKNLKSAMASLISLGLVLCTVAPAVMVSAFLNSADPEKLGKYPYLYLIQYHQHVIPFLAIAIMTVNSFVGNPKLKNAVLRQIKTLNPLKPVSVSPGTI